MSWSGRDAGPDDLARGFEPAAQSIRNRVAGAGGRTGSREQKGPTGVDADGLARLRREVRQLWQERDILSKAALGYRVRSRASAVRVLGGVGARQASFPITAIARVPGVSTAGHHAWLKRAPSAHARADGVLLQGIRTVHATSRATYGMPRVHAELQAGKDRHGRHRIARLMREAGLVAGRFPVPSREFISGTCALMPCSSSQARKCHEP